MKVVPNVSQNFEHLFLRLHPLSAMAPLTHPSIKGAYMRWNVRD